MDGEWFNHITLVSVDLNYTCIYQAHIVPT